MSVSTPNRLLVWWRRVRHRTTRRDFAMLAAILSGVGGATVVWRRSGLVFNHTASMPIGFYRIDRAQRVPSRNPPPQLARGATVVWCLPEALVCEARKRGYLVRGSCPGDAEPMLKVVAAVAGDTVVVDSAGMQVNGRRLPNSRPLRLDSRGLRLSGVAYGTYVVPPDTAWLWSPHHALSFDSRYFGGVPLSGLVGFASPVWVRKLAPLPAPSTFAR